MNEEVASAVLPPITGGPAVQPVAAMSNVRAITGVTRSYEAPLTPIAEQEVSLTDPGVSPMPVDIQSGSLAPARRSLAQRRGETLDQSAMTPAGFVEKVNKMRSQTPSEDPSLLQSVTVGGVRIELTGGAQDGSNSEAGPSGAPRSFKPAQG